MANHLTQATCTPSIRTTEDVVTWLESHQAHIYKLAIRWGLEYEEVYQQAALLALQYLDKPRTNWNGYIYTALRHYYDKSYVRSIHARSIDQPLMLDESITLADYLVSPESTETIPSTASELRIAALYTALHNMPLDEQMYFRDVYNLNYEPGPNARIERPGRTRRQISWTARKHLRQQIEL